MAKNAIWNLISIYSKLLIKENDVEVNKMNDYKQYEEYLMNNLSDDMKEKFELFKLRYGDFAYDLYDENCARVLFIGMMIGMEFQEFLDDIAP